MIRLTQQEEKELVSFIKDWLKSHRFNQKDLANELNIKSGRTSEIILKIQELYRKGGMFNIAKNLIKIEQKLLNNIKNDYRDTTTNTQKAVNLSPETKMELEQRNRNSFYSLNSEGFTLEDGTGRIAAEDVGLIVDEFGYTVRGVGVSNGFAYAGPRQRNLRAPFQRYAHNNGILLEGHTETGNSNIKLENESGVLTSEFGISASTTISDWAQLRFTGTLNTNVDGETMRLKDLEGTNSDLDHRNNFAFPTDITQEPS